MKVLLIGNDKFIAKALANRFLLEDDQVHLLGNFGKDSIDDLPEKVKELKEILDRKLSESGAEFPMPNPDYKSGE